MPSVLVTGASRGVGLSIARKLAGTGYQVAALARGHAWMKASAKPTALSSRFMEGLEPVARAS